MNLNWLRQLFVSKQSQKKASVHTKPCPQAAAQSVPATKLTDEPPYWAKLHRMEEGTVFKLRIHLPKDNLYQIIGTAVILDRIDKFVDLASVNPVEYLLQVSYTQQVADRDQMLVVSTILQEGDEWKASETAKLPLICIGSKIKLEKLIGLVSATAFYPSTNQLGFLVDSKLRKQHVLKTSTMDGQSFRVPATPRPKKS